MLLVTIFITVVHILQHSITRYNIYNPRCEKLEERGSFCMVDIIDFSSYNNVFDISPKIVFIFVPWTIIERWESKIVVSVCTHYFCGPAKYVKSNGCEYCETWLWQIVMEVGSQFGNLKHTIVSTLKCHIRNISHLFISIEFKYSKSLRTTIFNYGLMVLERCGSNKYNVCFCQCPM